LPALPPRPPLLQLPRSIATKGSATRDIVVTGARPGAGQEETARFLRGVLRRAGLEADVRVDEGDSPLAEPDLRIVVVDALRPWLPGCAGAADAVVVTRVDTALPESVDRLVAAAAADAPSARIVLAESPVELEPGPPLLDAAVVVVEDGPAVTEGGLLHGAATAAALQQQVGMRIDPRPYAVGAIADAYELYPHLTSVVPALSADLTELDDLWETLEAIDCDAVIAATPVALRTRHPVRRAGYRLLEVGETSLTDLLFPVRS
jgi:predicted GTPase